MDHADPGPGAPIRTGPLRAAERILAERPDAGSGGAQRDQALTRLALGRLLREDGIRGLSHPSDPALRRPGIAGSAVGVVVAGIVTAVPLTILTVLGVGPLAAEEATGPGGPGGFPGPGEDLLGAPLDPDPPVLLLAVVAAFAALGLALLVAALVVLVTRTRCVLRGRRWVRDGRRALDELGVVGVPRDAEERMLERVYPRFAGMLSWTRPSRDSDGHRSLPGHHGGTVF